jgi:hypothetical protein
MYSVVGTKLGDRMSGAGVRLGEFSGNRSCSVLKAVTAELLAVV